MADILVYPSRVSLTLRKPTVDNIYNLIMVERVASSIQVRGVTIATGTGHVLTARKSSASISVREVSVYTTSAPIVRPGPVPSSRFHTRARAIPIEQIATITTTDLVPILDQMAGTFNDVDQIPPGSKKIWNDSVLGDRSANNLRRVIKIMTANY